MLNDVKLKNTENYEMGKIRLVIRLSDKKKIL